MASRACSLNEAFDWLTTQLAGRKANPTVVEFEPTSVELEPQQPRGYRFKLVAFDDMRPGLEQL